ncbi:hypothetical protein QF001_000705 [Paraburkholderia youngii]
MIHGPATALQRHPWGRFRKRKIKHYKGFPAHRKYQAWFLSF